MQKSYDVNYENILNGSGRYVLMILNQSLNADKSNDQTFKNLWKNGRFIRLFRLNSKN